MRSRAFRPIAAMLSVMLLLASAPVQAAPVAINEIIQVLGNHQNPPELRLRSFQTAATPLADINGWGRRSSVRQSVVDGSVNIPDDSVASADASDTLLSGMAVDTTDPQGVEIIDQGEVEGTICDCGEITVPGRGIPKWPLLFLAAIPLLFLHGCDDCDTPTPTPTPTPEVPIPEPASLLLLGSGLAAFGAGLRRRYAKARIGAQAQNTEEG